MLIDDLKNKSKGQKLLSLNNKLRLFKIPETICLNCSDVYSSKKHFINKELLVVRSSASDEDEEAMSSAGEFESVLNVDSSNAEKISEAIQTVVASYIKKRPLLADDEVIIQEMIQNTTMSGVIFTHDLNTGAPYYVINYDDVSGMTDTVTSGASEYANRTLYIHRNSIDKIRSQRFITLLSAVQELEQVMGSQFLDIEFALSKDLTPHLLQVRAITTKNKWNNAVSLLIDKSLKGIHDFVGKRLKKASGVYGDTTILGQMPDWNPVEMIGRAPRALALSLYEAVITDSAWSRARTLMGYAVPRGQPLMVSLSGQPFIDTRLSFHSFLPASLPPKLCRNIVNHWVKHLKDSPELHDKVEFDVAITAYSFDIDEKIDLLLGKSFDDKEKVEFKEAHLKQTRKLIRGEDQGSLSNALKLIERLKTHQTKKIYNQNSSNISLLFETLSDCVEFGTIPFSILARHGFIARIMLNSLYNIGIMSKDEMNHFLESIQTVASDLVDDMHALQAGKLTNAKFMSVYGHLRPGTYDIMSQRYDQMGDISSGAVQLDAKNNVEKFEFSNYQKIKINKLLVGDGFGDFDCDDLLNYIRNAIVGREYGKFVFTRSVSDMLELIAKFSMELGVSRDQISHVPLNDILNTIKSSSNKAPGERLRLVSKREEEKHQISLAIRLPQVLSDQAGVHIIPFQVSHPNFITQKNVIAESLVIQNNIDKFSLKGKIIIIEGADPGFDWIFTQEISGLITKYGGVNSHMAIRCAEFGIPAAIGCGEQRHDMLLKSNKVHLDCAAGLINILH